MKTNPAHIDEAGHMPDGVENIQIPDNDNITLQYTPPADSPSELATITLQLQARTRIAYKSDKPIRNSAIARDKAMGELETYIAAHDRRRDEAHLARLLEAVGEDAKLTGEKDSFERLAKVTMNAFRAKARAAIRAELGGQS